jgi:hypothetical protein
MEARVGTIQESAVHKLHPTQLTVGMIEVKDKAHHLGKLPAPEQREFMRAHPIPAVVGPGQILFITDHHHLGRAALEADVSTGFFEVEADLSKLETGGFWKEMDRRCWVHPLDENGVRHQYSAIPKHLEQLIDDLYRSLAGFVRDAGGYEKSQAAFAEFVWADFFRRQIAIEDVKADFKAAVEVGLVLARSERARSMPGFHGK